MATYQEFSDLSEDEKTVLEFIYSSKSVYQSSLHKELDLTSAKCGKIASKLTEIGFINKEPATFEGSKTSSLTSLKLPIDYSLLMAGSTISPFLSHPDAGSNSEYFTEWILNLPAEDS
jgi:hypothetical protein